LLAAFPLAIGAAFLAHEREAIWHVRGAWGEDFTRDELERARRRKLIWGWVDAVTVQSGDIDHLVVTKAGGLVAIDSKWRTDKRDIDPRAMAVDANKVKQRAEGVIQTLLRAERGSHRASVRSSTVTPVVAIWGAAQDGVPENVRIDGVEFVAGSRLVEHLGALEGETIEESAAADLLARIESFRSTAWAALAKR
jgi:hypothetical protein